MGISKNDALIACQYICTNTYTRSNGASLKLNEYAKYTPSVPSPCPLSRVNADILIP